MTNAGNAADAIPQGAPLGAALVNGTAAPWFYGLAACNLNTPAGYPADSTILGDLQHVAHVTDVQRGEIATALGPSRALFLSAF